MHDKSDRDEESKWFILSVLLSLSIIANYLLIAVGWALASCAQLIHLAYTRARAQHQSKSCTNQAARAPFFRLLTSPVSCR